MLHPSWQVGSRLGIRGALQQSSAQSNISLKVIGTRAALSSAALYLLSETIQ
jgi:hypothetical protein